MDRLHLGQDIKPLSEFRGHVASFIRQVHDTRRPLVITHHGKSAAVLLDVSHYESLLEQLEILSDVHAAEEQIRQGKGLEHSVAKKQILKSINE